MRKFEFRPWGWFESLKLSDNFQVKRIFVKPGAAISLQSHKHRSEHWIVVNGTALVEINDKTSVLKENESTFIPLGCKHRLSNAGSEELVIIEVQSGAYLEEDDIERFDDDHGRIDK